MERQPQNPEFMINPESFHYLPMSHKKEARLIWVN